MEGRESMASFYMQRGMGGAAMLQSPPPGFRPLSNQGLMPHSDGSTLPVESLASGAAGGGGSGGAVSSGEPVKRKRGRPRKYGPDGMQVPSALSPVMSSAHGTMSALPVQKRGRGRPPGSGFKQQLAALGEMLSGSAGSGFTPHVITVSVGEDVASKIMSFSQQGPRTVCILSANGSISTATLRQPASSGGTVTYEGRFEILCMSGSYLLADNNGSSSRTGGLSVSLSSPDGCVIGGGVGGMLIAASPVQVIAGSFMFKSKKSGTARDSNVEEYNGLTSGPPSKNLSPVVSGWPSSDTRGTHPNLDLTQG